MKLTSAMRGLMRGSPSENLPYRDPFSPSEKAVLEHALRAAMALVMEDQTIDLGVCNEVDITHRLELVLNRMLESNPSVVKGFSKAVFQTVVRGAELHNHSGALPEKRPDLALRSQRPLAGVAFPHQCALLVECKLVDRQHSMNRYAGDGISRFVEGTYAWAVSSAIMLGYARDGFHPSQQLKRHLGSYGERYALVGTLRKRDRNKTVPAFYITVHKRELPILPSDSPITLHHLWVEIV